MSRNFSSLLIGSCLAALAPACVDAAPPLDRSDPSLVEDRARRADEHPVDQGASVPVAGSAAGASAIGEAVQVGAIRIEGTTVLPPSHFASVIQPYAGRLLSPAELEELSSKVADAARAAGYGLATAWIPPQKISNGVLRVILDEGRIDAIDATGPGAEVVRPILATLANGRPVRTAVLERQLLLAGDIAGVEIGRTRLMHDARGTVLTVETSGERVEARAYLDNWGTSSVGPWRARAYGDFNGIAGADQLSLSAIITPFDPAEFGLIGVGYERAVGTAGTTIGIDGYVATTHPGAFLDDFDIDGRSVEGEIKVSQPLIRSRTRSLWLDGAFRISEMRQSRDDDRIREDQLAILSATANGYVRDDASRLRARFTVSQGLDAFGATERGDPLASRDDAGGRFTKLDLWLEYRRTLSKRFSLLLQSQGQVASGPLLSSEEMGLGGRYFLRGYDYREYSGDKGIAGAAEMRFDLAKAPKPLSDVQFYAYADAGSVGNYRGGGGGGSLASAGGGVRMWLGRALELGLELGVPLTKSDFSANKHPRFSLTLGSRF